MSRRALIIALVSVPGLLTGCAGSLFESKAPVAQTYVISPQPPAAATSAERLNVDISVAQPSAAPGLNSDRILLIKNGRELNYFSHAQWGAAAPRLIEYFLLSALQNQERFRGVTSEELRTAAPYVLDMELKDFQAEYSQSGAPPTVKVTITVALMRVHDRKLLAILPVTASAPAAQDRMSAIVAAFEQASRQVAASLGEQLSAAIRSAPPANPAVTPPRAE